MKVIDVTPMKFFITGHHHNDHLCDYLGDCADSGKTFFDECGGKKVEGTIIENHRFIGWSEDAVNAVIELAFKKYKDVRETYRLIRAGRHIKIEEIIKDSVA